MSSVTQENTRVISGQKSETDQVATAINEMTATVREVAQNVEATKGPANEAREAFKSITEAVTRIQAMNQQIAASVTEQSAVAEDINRSILSISESADQTATASEETLQSNQELSRLGVELQEVASKFRLGNG
jgi:methyl-accepting chemotaxis protein